MVQLKTNICGGCIGLEERHAPRRSKLFVLVTSSPGLMRSAVSRGSHPYSLLRIGYVNFYCKRMSVSGRSHYRGSLPVICFRRTTSWASSRAVNVCVCARVIYIERCCHVCAVCSHTYVEELHSTWQHGADSVAFYLLKVISALRSMSYKWGNLVVARAGWMDAEEERSKMKVEVNI